MSGAMNGAELYEMLDRLPDACDDFIVRFTTRDRTEWVELQAWRRIETYIFCIFASIGVIVMMMGVMIR